MGIFGELFGGEKNAEFVADQPQNAAETPITPENKQDILPDASTFTLTFERPVANAEAQDILIAKSGLQELHNLVDSSKEELPKQN